MAIKKLKVSFDIDAEMFAKMLAHGHSAMNIEVYGNAVEDSDKELRVSHTEPKLITDRGGLKETILAFLSSGSKHLSEMRVIIVRAGYSASSLNSAIDLLQSSGLIRRVYQGTYAITKKGASYGE